MLSLEHHGNSKFYDIYNAEDWIIGQVVIEKSQAILHVAVSEADEHALRKLIAERNNVPLDSVVIRTVNIPTEEEQNVSRNGPGPNQRRRFGL